jgi:hypothetical protein
MKIHAPAPPALTDSFDRDHRRLAAPDAKRGDASAKIIFAQRGDQCDDNARPGCADGMTKRASAAVNIHLVVWKIERAHRRHCDNGEGFIDFEQVDVG